jgi:sterol desaturase/sphingolipid hydroxylase (fatty acid hydroxylase superfamily)
MANDLEQSKPKDNNEKNKSRKPPTLVRTSRMFLFLLGANLLLLFTPRIGMIHSFLYVDPMLSLLCLLVGIGICVYAFSTMYYSADEPQQ